MASRVGGPIDDRPHAPRPRGLLKDERPLPHARFPIGAGQRQAAADELLEIIRRNRAWNEEGARKQLVTFFEAWGPTDPLTLETRRRLSSLLFA